jgi:hypothetical protein
MYRLINKHIEPLLERLQEENLVQDYDNLMHMFRETDVAVDREFQNRYANFWAFQGVNAAWRQRYFRLLQDARNERSPDLRRICDETIVSLEGEQRIQFSFATKLAHMVDPTLPIYDSKVRAFYFLPAPTGSFKTRLDGYFESYNFLVAEYKRIVEEHLLDASIDHFRKELQPTKSFTNMKIIDSLIWAFVSWAGPAFLRGGLHYE